jgi:hypothetical protein
MQSLVKRVIEAVFIAAVMLICLIVGIHHGEQQGIKKALNTNPVSEELELVCAGLWVGEQNKKANK